MPSHQLALLRVARSLAASALAVRLMEAMSADGVDALVFKGPVTERWLYGDAPRGVGDVDVIVDPGSYAAAERVLGGLGFVSRYDGAAPSWAETHAESWRSDHWPLPVDLHRRIWGLGLADADAWDVLWAQREEMTLDDGALTVPSEPLRLLLVALHAAHHDGAPKPLEDLRRACARPRESWHAAVELARALDATGGLVAGLQLSPEGSELMETLPLDGVAAEMPHVVPVVWSVPPTTEAFLRLRDAQGPRAKLALLGRELVPSAEFMRTRSVQSARARRSRRGLWAAHVLRWASLAPDVIGGYRASRRLLRRR